MILSSFKADELSNIIYNEQAQILKTVKGLGLKTAQKIIVELKDKVQGITISTEVKEQVATDNEILSEGVSALTMLGFTRAASEKVLRQIFKESPSISIEDAIRAALKRL
jgi:Holliday junction DNA helicase RuvA